MRADYRILSEELLEFLNKEGIALHQAFYKVTMTKGVIRFEFQNIFFAIQEFYNNEILNEEIRYRMVYINEYGATCHQDFSTFETLKKGFKYAVKWK